MIDPLVKGNATIFFRIRFRSSLVHRTLTLPTASEAPWIFSFCHLVSAYVPHELCIINDWVALPSICVCKWQISFRWIWGNGSMVHCLRLNRDNFQTTMPLHSLIAVSIGLTGVLNRPAGVFGLGATTEVICTVNLSYLWISLVKLGHMNPSESSDEV